MDETVVFSDDDFAEAERRGARSDARLDDQLLGAQVDKYQIERLLGKGGMGRVYLARHLDLHRPCALKILSPARTGDDADYVERFWNEGRAAAALVHPNIVTVHAIGQAEPHYFLEMEFVPGRSLRQLIQDEGKLPPLRAVALASRIADGLAAAHRAHIVHRDLKLDNVLLTLHGIPKLADFGLASRVVRAGGGELPEGLCGTPHYIAPEMYRGQSASPASDVYALGVSLFYMLAGYYPYQGESLAELMQAVVTQPLPDLAALVRGIPEEIVACVERLLARDPADRPADAVEAGRLLQAILGETRDLQELVREAFVDDAGVAWRGEQDRFRVRVQLPDERQQVVWVEPSTAASAERVLTIFSRCGPAEAAYYESALRLNSEIPHGSIAIREIDGAPNFIVINSYPRSTVDAEEIRRSVHEIAARADAIELMLTNADRH